MYYLDIGQCTTWRGELPARSGWLLSSSFSVPANIRSLIWTFVISLGLERWKFYLWQIMGLLQLAGHWQCCVRCLSEHLTERFGVSKRLEICPCSKVLCTTSPARLTRYESLAVFRRLSVSRVGSQLKPPQLFCWSSNGRSTETAAGKLDRNLKFYNVLTLVWLFNGIEERISTYYGWDHTLVSPPTQ